MEGVDSFTRATLNEILLIISNIDLTVIHDTELQ